MYPANCQIDIYVVEIKKKIQLLGSFILVICVTISSNNIIQPSPELQQSYKFNLYSVKNNS